MKRHIATLAVAATLAVMAVGYTGASALAREAELRHGLDDPIATPTATATATPTATATATPTATATATASPTATTTTSASPTATATPAATARPATSPTASPTATGTPELRSGSDDPPGDDRGLRGRG